MKPPTPTSLDYALLALLHQAPSSGYHLRKVFATTMMQYSGSPGAIYPALKRLERWGLIEGEVDRSKSLRPRRLFRPTEAGTEVFRSWLLREVTREEVIRGGNELMLRFTLHPFLGSRRASREFLAGVAREVAACAKDLEGELELMPPEAPVHGRLVLEHGIEQYRATVRWARKSLRHFQEEESFTPLTTKAKEAEPRKEKA